MILLSYQIERRVKLPEAATAFPYAIHYGSGNSQQKRGRPAINVRFKNCRCFGSLYTYNCYALSTTSVCAMRITRATHRLSSLPCPLDQNPATPGTSRTIERFIGNRPRHSIPKLRRVPCRPFSKQGTKTNLHNEID